MEFDINRVYTAVNADVLKPGSKVLVADDIATLRQRVEDSTGEYPETLNEVNPDDCTYRFHVGGIDSMLCYLISEPKEPRRMTNRELARWLAQGNGQWKGSADTVGTSYSYGLDDHEVPLFIKIRGWDEEEWREPIIEEDK